MTRDRQTNRQQRTRCILEMDDSRIRNIYTRMASYTDCECLWTRQDGRRVR